MTLAQITSIVALLLAFGVNQPIVNQVQTILETNQTQQTAPIEAAIPAAEGATVTPDTECVESVTATTTGKTLTAVYTKCGDVTEVPYWVTLSRPNDKQFFKGNLDNGFLPTPYATTQYQLSSNELNEATTTITVQIGNASTTIQN